MDNLLSIALSLLIIFMITTILRKRNGNKSKLPTPPGPPGLPLIGNFHHFHITDLHLRLTKFSKQYGPIMLMNLAQNPVLVISSGAVAKQALKDNDLAFSGRPYTTTITRLSYNHRDIITATYDSYWREVRKLAVLHLFTPKQVRSFLPVREEEVACTLKEISEKAEKGEVIDLSETLVLFSSRLICREAFGKKNIDNRKFGKLLQDVQEMLVSIFWADCSPMLGWMDRLTGNTARLEKVFKDVDSFTQKLLDEHLDPNRPKAMNNHDILDMLIQLKEEEKSSAVIDWENIKALLLNIFVGGTDTTAATTTWAMAALAKDPTNKMEKAQTEIRNLVGDRGKVNEDDVEKLPYLKAIVKEIFRMYPPTPLGVPRVVIEKCTVAGYEIQPETLVYYNLWAIGRDPECWENPEEFMPERFLNTNIDYKGHDFGLIPFGSGRRICPGMGLGVATLELALANLLYSFDWKLPPGVRKEDIDTDAIPGFILYKKNPLRLVAKQYAFVKS